MTLHARRAALVNPRQSFEKWSLEEKVASGSNLNLLGWLHERTSSGMQVQRKFHVPDTLVFHQGALAGWFFSSKQNGALLCKHRRNLTLDHVLQDFQAVDTHQPAMSAASKKQHEEEEDENMIQLMQHASNINTKIALLFRGINERIKYLTSAELQSYLEHKSITDSQTTTVIIKLPNHDFEEDFHILKVTWMNGHCLIEARTCSGVNARSPETVIVEKMRALDSFVNEFNPILRSNHQLTYRDVEESWLGAKLQDRVRSTVAAIVRHAEELQPKRLKKLVCMFRLSTNNELSYLFPLTIELVDTEPPPALLDAVAAADYYPRWNTRKLFVRKEISTQLQESGAPANLPREIEDFDDSDVDELMNSLDISQASNNNNETKDYLAEDSNLCDDLEAFKKDIEYDPSESSLPLYGKKTTRIKQTQTCETNDQNRNNSVNATKKGKGSQSEIVQKNSVPKKAKGPKSEIGQMNRKSHAREQPSLFLPKIHKSVSERNESGQKLDDSYVTSSKAKSVGQLASYSTEKQTSKAKDINQRQEQIALSGKPKFKPKPPGQPRPARSGNPVQRLIRAYGTSKSARRLESWLKRRRERPVESPGEKAQSQRAFISKLHAKLNRDFTRSVVISVAESIVHNVVKRAVATVTVHRSAPPFVSQYTGLTDEESEALAIALSGVDSAMTRCHILQNQA